MSRVEIGGGSPWGPGFVAKEFLHRSIRVSALLISSQWAIGDQVPLS